VVTCDRTFSHDGQLCDRGPGNDDSLYGYRNRQRLLGNGNFHRNSEPEPGCERELADDLFGRLGNFNGYRRDFVHVVACDRTFSHDGQLRDREPGNDDGLHGYRNRQRLYGNGDFDRNGEPDACSERAGSNYLRRRFNDADGHRRYFVHVVACDRAFVNDGKLRNGQPGNNNDL
jgi:hypothetical protein